MLARIFSYLCLGACCLFIFTGCDNTKYLPANESLYTGPTIVVKDSVIGARKRKTLRRELQPLTRPRPNRTMLGLRVKLWAYNIAGNPKKRKGLRGWLKYKFGEPPVLLSDVNRQHNALVLQNYLENIGFFNTTVNYADKIKKKRATVVYHVYPRAQYTINNVIFPPDTTPLLHAMDTAQRRSLLKKNDRYDLAAIKNERERINARVKNRGFYFFNPDYLIVQVDSTIGHHKVDLYIKLKEGVPEKAKQVYKINNVYIYSNYTLNKATSDTNRSHAEFYEGYYVVDTAHKFVPRLFQQALQYRWGDIYRQSRHNQTLNRLVSLNLFKFVKSRFEEAPGIDSPRLNAYYYLTPLPKKSLRLEVMANTRSNNMTGSLLTVGWRNRNTFRGGELLAINATGGFEVQYSSQLPGYNTYQASLEPSITFPRFLIPFVDINPRGGYLPKTNIQLGYDVMNKQKLYSLNSFRFQYGYIWKENLRKEHRFNPISIVFVKPTKVTQLYADSIKSDPVLKRAIEKQFILGTNYNYNYNQLVNKKITAGLYFNGNLDVSGNIASLLRHPDLGKGDTAKFFGQAFSQYLRGESDLRYYSAINENVIWANRLIVGVGYPYGNSRELPFVKQFFVGGTNSIRAFRSRSLGPGTYRSPDADSARFLPDQTGDIKLEINTELRARLFSIVQGALFVDAGNIWLYNENPDRPGGKFSRDFLHQLAVGAGVGFRFDISILIIRVDIAFPLRKPWLPEGQRWVIQDIDFGSSSWRKKNLVFNLGIGYPF